MLFTSILFTFLFFLTNTSVMASDYQTLLVQKMNAERQSLGRSQIVLDSGLSNLAAVRAKEIAISFSHERPNNSAWHTVFRDHGLSTGYAGENIAKKSFSTEVSSGELADIFYTLWKNSPGHYQNMIKEEHRYLGLALYKEGNIYHMVQIFNSEPSSGSRPAPKEEKKSQAKPPPPKREIQKPASAKKDEKLEDSPKIQKDQELRKKARVEILKKEESVKAGKKNGQEEKIIEEDKDLKTLKKEKDQLEKTLQKTEKEHEDLQEQHDLVKQEHQALQQRHASLEQSHQNCEGKSKRSTFLLVFSIILNFIAFILLIFRKKRIKVK